MKVIKFYRKNQFGQEREYIHPDCSAAKSIITKLTGKETISEFIRFKFEELTEGQIIFQEVIAPK